MQTNSYFEDKGLLFLKFIFLGGLVGGILTGIYSFLFLPTTPFEAMPIWQKLLEIPFFGVLGAIFGLIPASLTGIWLLLRKLTFLNYWQFAEIFIIGNLSSWVFFGVIIPSSNYSEILIWMIIGGVSAIITSYLIFRKTKFWSKK